MKWLNLINKTNTSEFTIIAISDTGLMKRTNGSISPIPYRQNIRHNGKSIRAYRLLAETFIPKSEEDIILGRNCIDHITHNPIGMNINDVRNLRWCTLKENLNFDEARHNASLARKGKESKRKGNAYSEFGKLFKEVYGCYDKSINSSLYDRERMYYKRHGCLKGKV